jgi:polyhydroxyalkanoate synthase
MAVAKAPTYRRRAARTSRRRVSPSRVVRSPNGAATPIGDQAADSILGANPFVGIDVRRLVGDGVGWVSKLAGRPRIVASGASRIGGELAQILMGRSSLRPADGDRRFADPAWTDNPIYRRLLQAYLALVAAAHRLVDEARLAPEDSERAHFALTLFADALAPTNALAGNPAAVKRAFDTAGLSLVRGTRNLGRDLRENGGMPAMVDKRSFEVGRNVATSAGAVVFRNEVLELIQYTPTTETVYERPVVVIPPQINKYYVLDMGPGRSFTEQAVGSGIPYFAISWRNPTAAQREWDLDVYVRASLDAIEAAAEISGSDAVNVMGLCAGGVTMSLLLAYLAATGTSDKVSSATFAVTMLDLKSPTMMGMFASDEVVAMALRRSRQKGVLEGSEMARVFAWMRPNDLIWNYWVNNYLLGNDPPAFDILFWNADHTRLPAALHADFLDLYMRNPLLEPGAATVLGKPVDLKQIACPSYVVAGMTDHIVPWRAGYRTTRMLGGQPEFVLSTSGHIQSIVNPTGNPKAAYYAAGSMQDDPDEWLRTATQSKGSWWENWTEWVGQHSGERRPAPKKLGSRKHRPRESAPGQYVLQK